LSKKFVDKEPIMKHENLVKPPEKPCRVCGVLCYPYARTQGGDHLCSKKCAGEWDSADLRTRESIFKERRRL